MNEQDRPASEVEKTRRRLSSGFWWTGGAVALVALSHLLPKVWPSWFVEPPGQVGGGQTIFGFFGALVAVGLLYGSRVARWIAIAYLGLTLFSTWQVLTIPGFRETGWLVVAALNVAALGILAFAPAVKYYFAKDETSRAQSAA
jgi:hypothetical protein